LRASSWLGIAGVGFQVSGFSSGVSDHGVWLFLTP
jgi:hypothetical protein